jgi:hypothetical protein
MRLPGLAWAGALFALLLSAARAQAQGTFQNLNFEQAQVPSVPFGQGGDPVSVSNGVPGWAVYLGGVQQTTMFHNDTSLGAAEVAILGPQWFSDQILEGSYTVSLQPATAGPPTTTAIGQTGLVPATAQSLRFYGRGAYTVTFAGQPIPLETLATTSSYTIFGGDISAFGNQTGQLLFQGGGLLDGIQFSDQAVPEPSILDLSALGALVFGCRVLRRQR